MPTTAYTTYNMHISHCLNICEETSYSHTSRQTNSTLIDNLRPDTNHSRKTYRQTSCRQKNYRQTSYRKTSRQTNYIPYKQIIYSDLPTEKLQADKLQAENLRTDKQADELRVCTCTDKQITGRKETCRTSY